MTRRSGVMLLAIVASLAGAISTRTSAQRDAATVPVGTGEIHGVVVGDESAPVPIRRAIVTVTGGDPASSRSVLTDDSGRFAVLRLPPGKFSVGVKKAAYLAAAYGAAKPGRQGSEIALGAGQRVSISITMSRGAVIS